MICLYKLSIAPGIDYEAAGDQELELLPGARVVVKCDRYCDIGHIGGIAPALPGATIDGLEAARARQSRGRHLEGRHLPRILRRAVAEDEKKAAVNERDAEAVHLHAIGCIRKRNLEMKLVRTRYSLDRKVIFFQFSADSRIDFRELIRELSGSFRARIELRQVGVRDEAAILGGIGPCGRPLCCAHFLRTIGNVNVKTAKMQGLSLNPQSISGYCGRLRCCLQFEADGYQGKKPSARN